MHYDTGIDGVFYGSQTTKWGSISSLSWCSLLYLPQLSELLYVPDKETTGL